ncbi:MAG: insulinase family protein [Rikenellaceae bacterium]|jgi:predicted Zn-dependent peptidase|nr:insulinase family protein [Rikenellaceae bacterium]
MIEYKKLTLDNGMTVMLHRDRVSEMAAVNVLYRVGARNENPLRTGFAHLFEHLMFRGTRRVPDFDSPVQLACGENNAFTTNDYTDFYIALPKDNIETALWLEADRVNGLNINFKSLEAEKKVVIEEFNQCYLNQPYGDQWMLLRDMAYKVHPYRWATIGATPDHIRDATAPEVKAFYKRYYQPCNAILSLAAGLDYDRMARLAEKWFGGIPSAPRAEDVLPAEPAQNEARRVEVERRVPSNAITIAFRMGPRAGRQFYICDLASDILAGGNSGRLYQRLVKDKRLFSSVNAYMTGELDPGLFVVTGHLLPETAVEQGERALWSELEALNSEPPSDYDMEKVKNKFEANTIFGELNVMNKAMNMGFYEMLGKAELINTEVDIYRSITREEVVATARELFDPRSSSTLIYHAI